MDPRLKKLVAESGEDAARSNPPVNAATILQFKILRSGMRDRFSEDDLIEACQAMGLEDEDIAEWIEALSSFV